MPGPFDDLDWSDLLPKKPKAGLEAIEDYQEWLDGTFPEAVAYPMAPHHEKVWTWAIGIEPDKADPGYVICWPRGGGKCYAKGVTVMMSDGSVKAIEELTVGDSVLSYNEGSGRIEADSISKVWPSRILECISLKTASGKTIAVSEEHKILTYDGWKRAGDIGTLDRIASPRRAPISPSVTNKTDEEVKFVAYLICDGSLTGQRLYTKFDPRLVEDFKRCASAVGFRVVSRARKGAYYIATGTRLFAPWAESNGLWGHKSTSKRVPSWVFGLDNRQKWIFLATLIDSDGWVEAGRSRMGIAFSNQELIQDVVTLFLHVGVHSSVTSKKTKCADAWTLMVDQESLIECARCMPLVSKGAKLIAAASRPGIYSLIDTYPEQILKALPPGVNRTIRNNCGLRPTSGSSVTRVKLRKFISAYAHDPWVKLEDADVFWDKVESITTIGLRETFDVEVSVNHNLIANHLVAHNSSTAQLICVYWAVTGKRKFVLIVSETQVQANKHLREVSDKLLKAGLAPEIAEYGNRAAGWRADLCRCSNGFIIVAYGLDTAMRGLKISDLRPDAIYFDDLDSIRDSSLVVDNKIDAMTTSVMPVGAPHCTYIFAQNMIHDDSIMSRMHEGKADFMALAQMPPPVPAIEGMEVELRYVEKVKKHLPFIVGGTATWEGQSLTIAQHQMHSWGLTAFKREAQHEVHDVGGIFFDVSMLKEIPDLPRDRDGQYVPLRVCLGTDLAATEGGGDWTVFLLMATDGASYYIIDMVRGQWSSEKVRDWLLRITENIHNAWAHYSIRLAQDPGQAGKAQMVSLQQMLSAYKVNFRLESGAKAVRSRPLQNEVNTGNVYLLPDNPQNPWHDALKGEWKRFREDMSHKHDDIVDAGSSSFNELSLPPSKTTSRLEDRHKWLSATKKVKQWFNRGEEESPDDYEEFEPFSSDMGRRKEA